MNTTKSYVDTRKLRLPLTQLNNNQYPSNTNPTIKSMNAVVLHLLAVLIFLFCTSPNNRRQIWTSTSQDQHFLGLRIPSYACTTPFPIAISHKSIRAEEIIVRPHILPILLNVPTMNTNSYALAVIGASSKAGRKASDISESPARQATLPATDWPVIGSDDTPGGLSRTQGSAKKGKTSSAEGSQRKLNAFFALANANKKTITSPTMVKTHQGVLNNVKEPTAVIATPSSPPNPKRLLKSTPRSDPYNKDKPIPSTPSLSMLSPLGKTRGNVSIRSSSPPPGSTIQTASGKKADPPTNPTPESLSNSDMDKDVEMETALPTVKVYPKSSKSAKSASSTKRKSARNLSVGFSPSEPKQVQLVEPEDAPLTPKLDHPYKTVLTATVRIEKVKDALSHFITKMTDTLAFLRTHVDPTMAILPKSSDFDNEHIVDKLSFPTVVFLLNQRYFNIETRGAFMDTLKSHNGRTVKLSLILGSTVQVTPQLLEEVRHDTTNLGVTFWYKPHQEVDTTTRLVFLGAPNNANKEEAKDIIDRTLQPLEQHLLSTDPKTYPVEVFGLPWPNFAVVSEQPTGQPFVQPETGKDGKPIQKLYVPPPPERRSLHIMCKKSDYSRLASLTTVAKARNMWLKEFGMCYPVEAPDHSYSKTQCNDYLKMVDVHESAQLSYGTFRISGLKDPGVPSLLRREAGDPITISVRQIMRMITTPREIVNGKVVPGQPVWLCVLLSDNGSYTGYYAGANSKHQKFASVFAKCPAAQIRYFLIRHGIVQHEDVNKFIRDNFSMAQVRLIGQAKWNSRAGLATVPVQPGEENILDAARVDNSLVDLAKLTKRGFEEEEPIVGEYNGPSAADPAYYKFDSAQSVTTIHHNTDKIKSTSAGKSVDSPSIGDTVFTLRDDNSNSEDDDDVNAGGFVAASDPLTSLRNEEMQFDLSFMASQLQSRVNNDSVDSSGQSDKDSRELPMDATTKSPVIMSKELGIQFNDAASDAGLAAAAIGLNLSSIAHEDIRDEDCFVTVLAGISEPRSFEEMFEILERLIEEAEETDEEVARSKLEMNNHVPAGIRDLLVEEARESGESVLDHLYKLHGWLRESEHEAAEENLEIDRFHERQYDTDGSFLLPRPEDYGNEEPQGCEHREMMSSTISGAQTTSDTDDLTARLGAHTK